MAERRLVGPCGQRTTPADGTSGHRVLNDAMASSTVRVYCPRDSHFFPSRRLFPSSGHLVEGDQELIGASLAETRPQLTERAPPELHALSACRIVLLTSSNHCCNNRTQPQVHRLCRISFRLTGCSLKVDRHLFSRHFSTALFFACEVQ